jgi:hypothetical protein
MRGILEFFIVILDISCYVERHCVYSASSFPECSLGLSFCFAALASLDVSKQPHGERPIAIRYRDKHLVSAAVAGIHLFKSFENVSQASLTCEKAALVVLLLLHRKFTRVHIRLKKRHQDKAATGMGNIGW